MNNLIVTGTDTGIGKTIASAMLTQALDGFYWKPIQAGLPRDADSVQALTHLPETRILPERFVLSQPLSPHRAAELDGLTLSPDDFPLPPLPENRPLIIEGAGGLMVPINRSLLQIDLFTHWNAPLILCARTALGTINHTLLSVAAIRQRRLKLMGILFIGDAMDDTEATIVEFAGAKRLGRLPFKENLSADALQTVFAEAFSRADFETSDG
jgi:dethiobiotin synthetase